jgi:DnaJ-class molecular chaperone
LKNYYEILEIPESSKIEDIKKAYRNLSKKYHPDLNDGSKQFEDKFKEIAEAYSILGNQQKKMEYDSKLSRNKGKTRTTFEEWVNDFGGSGFTRDSGFNRSNRRRRPRQDHYTKPDTAYLDISDTITIDLVEAIEGKKVTLSYHKNSVLDFEHGNKEVTAKSIKLTIDLRSKHIKLIKKSNREYSMKVRLSKFGNEDLVRRLNTWGETETELLYGDYVIDVKINVPDNIEIEDGNIIQYVDIPLYKVMFKGEKIRVNTITSKSYDAEISNPSKLNDLKFRIEKQGIKSKDGSTGRYEIRFNVMPPDISKLNSSDIDALKHYLVKDLP